MSPEQQRQFKAQLIKEKRSREKTKELANIHSSHEWIVKNNFVNENGIPMEFEDRSFLVEPMTDESKLLVVMKCSQIGFSTISIFKAAFHNIKYGHNIIYTLPTDRDAEKFAKSKTDLILANNPVMKQSIIDDTLALKSFRTLDGSNVGFWFNNGTYGQSAAIMQTADILIKDEFDRSNQAILNQYKSRITASSYGAEWEFSNPSLKQMGVDATWQLSDQKHYFYKCPKCNHWAYITYEAETFDRGQTHHVNKEKKDFVCGSCGDILDRKQAKKQWVKKWSNRDIAGYWISQMMAPWISATKLMREEKLTTPDVWANFFLGLPYSSGSNQLDRADILKNIQYDELGYAQKNPGKKVVIGVDVGGTKDNPDFYIVRGTEQGLSKIEIISGEDSLHNYMRVHNVAMCVLDNNPYPEIGIALQKAFPGKVMRCLFDYDDKRKNIYMSDYKKGVVHVHRTRVFDYVVESYVQHKRPIYDMLETEPNLASMQTESLAKHWGRNYKVGGNGEQPEDKDRIKELKLDRHGGIIPTWERDGKNDLSLADIYMSVAQMLVERKVEIL